MDRMIITIVLVIFIIVFIILINYNECFSELFTNEPTKMLPEFNNPIFTPLYDNKGNKLNVMLISKPFGADNDYKLYLNNINKYIFIGITSYMEFPFIPSNPLDKYELETTSNINNNNTYNLDMYFKICEGWLHCFKDPIKYLPTDKPLALISESDFVNYNITKPDNSIIKEYDFIYNCPKVNETSSCNDWVSFNKNWELALKCLPILCEQFKLKGLLVGRKNCPLPENCKPYLETTGWLDYNEHIKMYKKAKFMFVPNVRDASPRVITEAMASGLPCLLNRNILGGWKYIDEDIMKQTTGTFFTDETDIADALKILLANMNKYNPRKYIIENYGPINAGKNLKTFLFINKNVLRFLPALIGP